MNSNRSTRQGRSPIPVALLALGLVALAGPGCSKSTTSSVAAEVPAALQIAGPTITALTKSVPGLSQAQAILAGGSALGLAKAKIPADQYAKVAGAIPGADELAASAASQGLPSSISSVSDVTSFLSKSGISPAQFSQIGGELGKLLKGKVPADVSNAFAAAFK